VGALCASEIPLLPMLFYLLNKAGTAGLSAFGLTCRPFCRINLGAVQGLFLGCYALTSLAHAGGAGRLGDLC
jgi:hypothetical protein